MYAQTLFYKVVVSLKTGQKFGDIALMDSNARRNATIISSQDSHFGVLNKDLFDRCLKKVNEKIINNKIKFILSFSVSSGFQVC